jgi:hypothetical protein
MGRSESDKGGTGGNGLLRGTWEKGERRIER